MEGRLVIEAALLVAGPGAEVDAEPAEVIGHEGTDRVVGEELRLPFAARRMNRRIPSAPVVPEERGDLAPRTRATTRPEQRTDTCRRRSFYSAPSRLSS